MSTARQAGPPLPHVLQLRLSDTQRRYLLFRAARSNVGMAAAARQLLEDALDREPPVQDLGEIDLPEHVRGPGLDLRAVLAAIPEDNIDELAAEPVDED